MSGRVSDLGGLAIGYSAGSLPVGLWLGRVTQGLDVRDYGSGSLGTTNVLRTVGPAAAAAVFALDVAKGAGGVLLARRIGASGTGQAAAGLAAVIGHSWPALARFRGGKSVATAFGAIVVLSPEGTVAAVVGGLAALAATRVVSVGSLAAAASATGGTAWALHRRGRAGLPAVGYALAASAIIAARHSGNLRRLARGEEPRLRLPGRGAAAAPEVPPQLAR